LFEEFDFHGEDLSIQIPTIALTIGVVLNWSTSFTQNLIKFRGRVVKRVGDKGFKI
jgi:hypothetical protein